jgi:hypothetical protein
LHRPAFRRCSAGGGIAATSVATTATTTSVTVTSTAAVAFVGFVTAKVLFCRSSVVAVAAAVILQPVADDVAGLAALRRRGDSEQREGRGDNDNGHENATHEDSCWRS